MKLGIRENVGWLIFSCLIEKEVANNKSALITDVFGYNEIGHILENIDLPSSSQS